MAYVNKYTRIITRTPVRALLRVHVCNSSCGFIRVRSFVSDLTTYYFKTVHSVALNYKIRNKQVTIEHNYIKYSYSYMFRRYGVIVRLTVRTY